MMIRPIDGAHQLMNLASSCSDTSRHADGIGDHE